VTAASWLSMTRMYAMARVASARVSVRGSPARSAISLHPSGMRTRASSAREGRASSSRAIAASTAGIPGYLADIPDGLIAERKVAPFRLCRQGRAGDATSIQTVLPIILIIAPARRRVFKSGLPNNSENGYLARQIGGDPTNPNSTRKDVPARSARSEEANLFLGSRRSAPDPGPGKMRARPEAVIARR